MQDEFNSRVCSCIDPVPTQHTTVAKHPTTPRIVHLLECGICGLPLGVWYSPHTTTTVNSITVTKVKPNNHPPNPTPSSMLTKAGDVILMQATKDIEEFVLPNQSPLGPFKKGDIFPVAFKAARVMLINRSLARPLRQDSHNIPASPVDGAGEGDEAETITRPTTGADEPKPEDLALGAEEDRDNRRQKELDRPHSTSVSNKDR